MGYYIEISMGGIPIQEKNRKRFFCIFLVYKENGGEVRKDMVYTYYTHLVYYTF